MNTRINFCNNQIQRILKRMTVIGESLTNESLKEMEELNTALADLINKRNEFVKNGITD